MELTIEFPSDNLAREVYEVAREWWLEIDYPHALAPDFDLYMRALRDGRAICFGCRIEDKLVGYAIFVFTPSSHSGVVQAVLDTMAFIPGQRKGLIGCKFVNFCIDRLLEDGYKEISMSVTTERDYSKMLTRRGFKEDSTIYVLRN